MNAADQETVSRMQAIRRVEWGHRGLTFAEGTRVVATLPFPPGPGNPSDGIVGSPERDRYRAACRDWVARGELPEDHVGAGCSASGLVRGPTEGA